LKDGKWATVSASEVEVGDIVLCKNEETFPADLVILASSSPDNVCYINTSSMDGEKNLKKRIIPKETGVPSGEVEYPTPDMITFIARCMQTLQSHLSKDSEAIFTPRMAINSSLSASSSSL